MNFSARPTKVYDLPIPANVPLLHPEQVVLQYYRGHSIDFGALCYLRRQNHAKRSPGQGRQVDLLSLNAERVAHVRSLIEFVSELVTNGRYGRKTVDGIHRNFVRFMDWCDTSGHSDALKDESSARDAFRCYVAHLRRIVAQHQLNNNTAAIRQSNCRDTLELFLNIESLSSGVNVLTKSSNFETPTQVPSDDAQGRVISWCQSLFYGLSELVIDRKPYPFSMTVPEYMNWPNDRLWIFPSSQWCEPPGSLHTASKVAHYFIADDYDTGTINTPKALGSEYSAKSSRARALMRKQIAKAHKLVDAANKNFRSRDRLDRAILASKIFAILFVANTGMSLGQAFSLPWGPDLDDAIANAVIERQGFRTIKYRAGDKTVWFEIGAQFMPDFRRYLQLRRYILDNEQFGSLFFSFGRSNLTVPVIAVPSIIVHTLKILNRFDSTLPKIMPREWRAAKQDHLIREYDPYVAARSMQHSLTTALRKYTNGSESSHQTEMGEFFSKVEKVVVAKGQEIKNGEVRSIGICAAPSHPAPISAHSPVQPDCKGPEGCLFCDQYRVHADETDTRKLLSCRYCVRQISHLANTREQFDKLFGLILNRIEFILSEIGRRDRIMVTRIEREVDVDGELDPYWAIKLETLMELDLV
ncbi:hypothetical protein [Paraburkholderia sp. MM5384-R2]|uniref:hypothetical protein n=1 Tax=Paraburkholderia sp. MM5384-R2 TaxID=2723097 RepID=UPI0016158A80|nr:hypothetical protein [Paraburkholderia sp. MM5384-R2]MBB5497631.1 hypothetical protein [Paraburkholderia sp. MM5384-R2]